MCVHFNFAVCCFDLISVVQEAWSPALVQYKEPKMQYYSVPQVLGLLGPLLLCLWDSSAICGRTVRF